MKQGYESNLELGSADFWERLRTDPARLAAEVCTIDITNLDLTLQRHASLRAWVSATFETARARVEEAQWQLTKVRARCVLQAKQQVDSATNKAKTVDVLRAEADADPGVEEATQRVHLLERDVGALKAMTIALEDRKDMLVQIAAKRRREETDYERNT